MARRKRPVGKRIYSIATLLERQPKALAKDPRYPQMIESLAGSDYLLSLRFNRRCYSLLHQGVIKPEHLENFYRTYRLPRHAFFPLFLAVKRAYLDERERAREQREEAIARLSGQLPPLVKVYWEAFPRWERRLRQGRGPVLFNRKILPKSLKKARLYASFDGADWTELFEAYYDELIRELFLRHESEGRMLLDRFILKLPPPPEKVDPKLIKARYRELSLIFHPDKGGEGGYFLKIKEARDRLTGD
ncbi:MAG: J domain-containing protein [Spirochaetales bacterium]|nr:J domain-containing protein [Spirochaetales bacterium]